MYRGGITLPSLFCPSLLVFWASEVSVLVLRIMLKLACMHFPCWVWMIYWLQSGTLRSCGIFFSMTSKLYSAKSCLLLNITGVTPIYGQCVCRAYCVVAVSVIRIYRSCRPVKVHVHFSPKLNKIYCVRVCIGCKILWISLSLLMPFISCTAGIT